MTIEKPSNIDIVIVGAGLVGTSVIAGLQNVGLRIIVLEKHLPSIVNNNKKDCRPLSLAEGGKRCLKHWGLWSSLDSAAMPIQTLHISEQGQLGRVQFTAKEMDLSALGYVVPFSLLQRTLYNCATSQSDVDFKAIEKITTLDCKETGVEIEYVSAGKTHRIEARLLIAADGTHSTCRDLLKITTEKKKTDDVAFIATLQCRSAHQGIAYQRFTQQGSFALLPLLDTHQYRLVWTLKKKDHTQVMHWTDQQLLNAIDTAYGGRLGTLLSVQREGVFPLEMCVAKESIRPSMVLLGNAAHTIYPVAAQGFNLALQDVAALTQVIKRARQQGESINALSTLQRYMDRRSRNQSAVIQWTNRVSTMFQWKIPFLDVVRGMAMLGMDALPFVKEEFARNFLHV